MDTHRGPKIQKYRTPMGETVDFLGEDNSEGSVMKWCEAWTMSRRFEQIDYI